MSTLARAAAAFVAILAGFYTTKIFSISTDKNRLEIKINDLVLEIQHKKEILGNYELQRVKKIEQDEDERINSFIHATENPATVAYNSLNSFDNVLAFYKEDNQIEGELSDREDRILRDKSKPLIEKFKQMKGERLKMKPSSEFVTVSRYTSEEIRNREFEIAMEKDRQSRLLSENILNEQIKIRHLEEELESNKKNLQSISFPTYWRFGFISFVTFAFLGVIIPLFSQWWYPYAKENTDLLAIISFIIGLAITFIYLGLEVRHIILRK